MLKLSETGVEIHLIGVPAPNYTLVFASVLGVFALIAAYLAITQPVAIAIGGLFVLATGCFGFNIYKEKLKSKPICSGIITASASQLELNGQVIQLSNNASIEIANNLLIIQDKQNIWQIGGFDNEKEMMVLKAVLQGEQIVTNKIKITMGK